jgi:hypothetical protein
MEKKNKILFLGASITEGRILYQKKTDLYYLQTGFI